MLNDMSTAQENAPSGARSDQLRVDTELDEQFIGIKIQDMVDFVESAVATISIQRLCVFTRGRLGWDSTGDASQRD